MRFTEFITFCMLRGYVKKHEELPMPELRGAAEKYFELDLEGRDHRAIIHYATIGKMGAITSCTLIEHHADTRHAILVPNADLNNIKKAFIPE